MARWGVCQPVFDHIDFYFANYIDDEGKCIYPSNSVWLTAPDSLSDYGTASSICPCRSY